jgi:ATP synthase in type III secretion protein N
MTSSLTEQMRRKLSQVSVAEAVGRVADAHGTVIRVTGIAPAIGEICRLESPGDSAAVEAEVIGVAQEHAVLMPMGRLDGISARTLVRPTGARQDIGVGPALLGRVLDAHGRPIDGGPPPDFVSRVPVHAPPPQSLERPLISRLFSTGVRSIDALLTCGRGQRLGVFAVAGAGKSTLLGMLARASRCDVTVVGLIGERGREVQEFITDNLSAAGLARACVVVATSDRPALERARAAQTATAVAEHFRDEGKDVLLLIDSVTRYARALRDVGLSVGELPARHGFPPSVFAELPCLFERAGASARGSITAFYTVLMEEEDAGGPIEEEVRSILDGHIVLTRKLAGASHYPAIDVLRSISRVMPRVTTAAHQSDAQAMRRLLAKYQEIELLVQIGEYKAGGDVEADRAVQRIGAIRKFLQQEAGHVSPLEQTLAGLREVAA